MYRRTRVACQAGENRVTNVQEVRARHRITPHHMPQLRESDALGRSLHRRQAVKVRRISLLDRRRLCYTTELV